MLVSLGGDRTGADKNCRRGQVWYGMPQSSRAGGKAADLGGGCGWPLWPSLLDGNSRRGCEQRVAGGEKGKKEKILLAHQPATTVLSAFSSRPLADCGCFNRFDGGNKNMCADMFHGWPTQQRIVVGEGGSVGRC